MFGSILGVISLGETVMLHGWLGVVMLCVGIVIVATDPGEKMEESGVAIGDPKVTPPLALWIGPALFCALAYALVSFIYHSNSSCCPLLTRARLTSNVV